MKNVGPLPSFTELLLDAILLVDVHGRIVYISAACQRIFGYTQDEMIGRSLADFIAPEDLPKTLEEAKKVMAGHARIGFENRYVRKDGSLAHLMWSARWSEQDQLRVAVARDVTELKHAQQMQAATYAVSEATHDATDLATLFLKIDQIIAELVPVAALAFTICSPNGGQFSLPYQRGCDGKEQPELSTLMLRYCAEVIRSGQALALPYDGLATSGNSAVSPNTEEHWLAVPLIVQQEVVGAMALKNHRGTSYSPQEKDLLHFISVQAATAIKRKQVNDELLRSARHDELTGLPNRRLFQDRLKSALSRSKRRAARMAVLFIDIDKFKEVNDSFGHDAGDSLLQEVALRLKQCLREEDVVARLGGDEFVVLLEDIETKEVAWTVADKLRYALHQPVIAGDRSLHAGASIGVALYPEHGVDAEELLRHADEEMYKDKNSKLA